MLKQLIAMHIKFLKFKFSMEHEDIKINLFISLINVKELGVSTELLMHYQILSSLVITSYFKTDCSNNSLGYNLKDFYMKVDLMNINYSHFSFKEASCLLRNLDFGIEGKQDFLGFTFY